MATARISEKFTRRVVPTYGRYAVAMERGSGSYLWDGMLLPSSRAP